MFSLAGLFFWHINPCRLFKAKDNLYITIYYVSDFLSNMFVGHITFKRAGVHLFVPSSTVSTIFIQNK